jgi:diguanylate cyclase (GGDEF)-like protein/PAS domain S-box-containing protein
MTSMSGTTEPTPTPSPWPEVGVALYDVSSRLAATPPEAWDTVIAEALCTLGKALDVDRAYLAWLDTDTSTFRESHEWCAPGIVSITASYQAVPISVRPHAYARMIRLSVNHVPDVAALPRERIADREYLLRRGAKALLEVPFAIDGEAAGVVGFERLTEPHRWTDADIGRLRVVASYIAQARARARAEEELARTTEQLRSAFVDAPVALALITTDGVLAQVNPAFGELSRLTTPPEGALLMDLVVPADRPVVAARFREALAHRGRAIEVEFRWLSAPDRWSWVTLRTVAEADTDAGAGPYVSAHFTDVTSRKATEAALDRSEHRFQTLMDNLPDLVVRLNLDGTPSYANAAAIRFARDMVGYSGSGPLWDILLEQRGRTWEDVRRDLEGGTSLVEITLPITTSRGPRVLETRLVGENDVEDRLQSILAIGRDVTEQYMRHEELAHLAHHDPLTGLANRASLLDHLSQVVAVERRGLALFFLDLDYFKTVNDTYGHAAGDEMLVHVAARLERSLRHGDVAARLGGDEFVIVARDVPDMAQAERIAGRIAVELGDTLRLGEGIVSPSASIGIALVSAGERFEMVEAEELLRRADSAMYAAKQQGRGGFVVFDRPGEKRS